jgi:hypothetical protein
VSWLVVVNYAEHQSQCYVRLPFEDLAGKTWRLEDRIGGAVHDREGEDLKTRGLFLDLGPWAYHAFEFKAVQVSV